MSHIRVPKDVETAKRDFLSLLRKLLSREIREKYPSIPLFPRKSFEEVFDLPKSESQLSNLSDYLDVERSKSLNSALKKCTRTFEEKKMVSFADSMGLDLCHVKHIFPYISSDEDILGPAPTVPIIRSSNSKSSSSRRMSSASLSSSFNCPRYLHLRTNPFSFWKDSATINRELLQKTKTNFVCLKSSNVIGTTFSGVIAVKNIAFNKQVHVRYTMDDWRTFVDMPAHFISSNSVEKIDNFTFSIFLPPTMPIGARCEFCIRYICNGGEYWDNNDGTNFILEIRTMADCYYNDNNTARSYQQPVFY